MSRKREIVSFYDFTGGLNDTSTPDRMNPIELEQADNIDLSVRGGFSYRYGTTNINQISFNDDVMYVIEYPLKDGNIIELSIMKDKKLVKQQMELKRNRTISQLIIDHVI